MTSDTPTTPADAALMRIERVADLLDGYKIELRRGAMLHANDIGDDPDALRDAATALRRLAAENAGAERDVLHRASVAVGFGEAVYPWPTVEHFRLYEEARRDIEAEARSESDARVAAEQAKRIEDAIFHAWRDGGGMGAITEAAVKAAAALPPEPEPPAISVSLYDRIADVTGLTMYGEGPTGYGGVQDRRRQRLHTALTAEGWMERPVLTEEERRLIGKLIGHLAVCDGVSSKNSASLTDLIRRLTGRPAGATTTTEEGK